MKFEVSDCCMEYLEVEKEEIHSAIGDILENIDAYVKMAKVPEDLEFAYRTGFVNALLLATNLLK